ncbi:ribonuclease BN-like family protein [Streptomyces jeddahensis]|uniref:Ribonuclease BN-like family protein n=2 Tax=Streptomyces jeddahensis TaxID=1716141 RepID=A0A177HU23_9ACTN|nr:ribonuclease BN-like family protein [Streptomyces jeddahensis]
MPPGPRGRRGRLLVVRMAPEERYRAAAERLGASPAGRLWSRLNAIDFLGNSFQLAALALMCFFPFLIVVAAAAGRDAAVVAKWLGLNHDAAQAVASLFTPGKATSTLTVASTFLLVLGAMGVVGVLQSWYQRAFEVPVGGWRAVVARLYWLASLVAYAAVQAVVGRALGGAVGGPLLQTLYGLVLATLFWWWSMHVLLTGAVRWRTLFPSALATGVCWTGLGVVSAFHFSSAIVVHEEKYGPIGVVMIILSWLVAVGVVVHLGAVVGRLYVDRRSRRHHGA